MDVWVASKLTDVAESFLTLVCHLSTTPALTLFMTKEDEEMFIHLKLCKHLDAGGLSQAAII